MKDGFVKVACCVPSIVVADAAHNAAQTAELAVQAAAAGAKLAVFPELGLTGATCADLFLQQRLLDAAKDALLSVAAATAQLDLLLFVGLPFAWQGRIYDVAAAIYGGSVLALVPKTMLSAEEMRHFASGEDLGEVRLGDRAVPFGTDLLFTHTALAELRVGCEFGGDLASPFAPSADAAIAGATVIACLGADAEVVGAAARRKLLVSAQSARLTCAYLYCGAGDGESTQDAVFTGHALICETGAVLAERNEAQKDVSPLLLTEIDAQKMEIDRRRSGVFGGETYRAVPFGAGLSETELTRTFARLPFVPQDKAAIRERCETIFRLQALGLKKRIAHTRAKTAIVGVSGGLDSTLALLVSVRAMALLGRPASDVVAVTMPCFGTTSRTRSNAERLAEQLGCTFKTVDISAAVRQHFADIGHAETNTDTTYENAQARERTQVLMDLAGDLGGFVVGTGDLSELALGWATYNGDHMSMYGVNASVPKTLMRHIVSHIADGAQAPLAAVLRDIVATPVSPELLPPKDGEIAQKTEAIVGPYELHDFFLYYLVRRGFAPEKVRRLANCAFAGVYDDATVAAWLQTFCRRFFSQQFKRSCVPDGPAVGTLTLSPRSDWRMPSDAAAAAWLDNLS